MPHAARYGQARQGGVARDGPAAVALNLACGALGAVLLLAAASVPLEPRQQAMLGILSAAIFLAANRLSTRRVSCFLVALSLAVSLRYIVWRMTDTLDFSSATEFVLGAGLALAEAYAILTLALGYLQTLWPLDRAPIRLPDDPAHWPTVDVLIPTYNEPLAIVRATVLGAAAIDWPPDKLRITLLDDGNRPEFEAFAGACGIGYIARAGRRHAKAGNLNHALQQTEGEFVAVFDCDHIPTRAFLQMTMGWMVAEPRCAAVQTAQHCYSPDPFQRNLAAGARVPAEANLFYGLVQDGNDFWNAALFCGSCAVLRRAALAEVGGFAVETVTEDAHTMLKLHRRGWQSCYLRLPLAAGLAPERLIRHIAQRTRWARGMIQIFCLDNPLLGPGLSLAQRLCYLQAMGHFFFALPRLLFLTAPLAFLLLGLHVIAASPLAILSYALPHLFHSVATQSRLQGRHRHSFWSGIYETVVALFLLRVTVATLIRPRRARFDVTPKGGALENGYFDLAAVYPNLILAVLLAAGVLRGVAGMAFGQPERLTFEALLLNTVWGSFSLLTVLAALAVGREARQTRHRSAVPASMPVEVHLPDGRVVAGVTRDLSQTGGFIAAERPAGVMDGTMAQLSLAVGREPVVIPARLEGWFAGSVLAQFQPQDLADEAAVVEAVFGRADAWTAWNAYPADRPLVSLVHVVASIGGLFRPPERSPAPPTLHPAVPRRRHWPGRAAALALVLLVPPVAQAAPRGSEPAVRMNLPTLFGVPPPPAVIPTISLATAQPPHPAMASPPGLPRPEPPAQTLHASFTPSASAPGRTRTLVLTLHQLGAAGPLTLRGTNKLGGVQFGIRGDEVVTGATLSLSGAMSPAMVPTFSNDTITLNDHYVGTIPTNPDQPRFQNLAFPIDPAFFTGSNRLTIRFSGRTPAECDDPLSGLLWSTISDRSALSLTLERLPPRRDLAWLPLPFFDPHETSAPTLPMILPATPSNDSLLAAGIVASWFGQLAGTRGARFPATPEAPAQGNGILVVTGLDRPAGIPLPPMSGPTLAVIPNPNDPGASLLLVGGRSGAEAVTAATALSLGSRLLAGSVATVGMPDAPYRLPYDAPAWLPTDRPVKLGELVDATVLQGTGYAAATIHVPVRTAPDLYRWRDRTVPLRLHVRAPPGPAADLAASRLDVGIDNLFLASLPLNAQRAGGSSWLAQLFGSGSATPATRVDIPAYDVSGQDDLQFTFDTRPLHRGGCKAIPEDMHEAVDPDSTIDLSGAYRFAELPNLAYFTSSGFPFTRLADLADTAAVLPAQPSPGETSAFLDLMGRFGALTGYPVIRLAVTRPETVEQVASRNLLLIAALDHLGPAASLLARSPYQVAGGRLQVSLPSALASVARLFGDPERAARDSAVATLSAMAGNGSAALVGAQSPYGHASLVALLGSSPEAVDSLVAAFHDPDQAPVIAGDLALLTGDRISSYRVGGTYAVGSLPLWLYPSWLLRDQPFALIGAMVAGCLLLAGCSFAVLRRRAAQRNPP